MQCAGPGNVIFFIASEPLSFNERGFTSEAEMAPRSLTDQRCQIALH
ncbi:hypothetical protein ACFLYS_01070 [Chloroflexota bacterium]